MYKSYNKNPVVRKASFHKLLNSTSRNKVLINSNNTKTQHMSQILNRKNEKCKKIHLCP